MRTGQSDRHLVERCIRKDPTAWATLVAKYSRLITIAIENRLRKYAISFSASDVEDIRQNVLASIWKNESLKTIRTADDISYWLAMVSGNAAIDYMRVSSGGAHRVREVTHCISGEETHDILDLTPAPTQSPHQALSDKELSDIITGALAELEPKERLIMKLYFFSHKCYSDIASIAGISRGTVAATIARSKEKLKIIIRKKM